MIREQRGKARSQSRLALDGAPPRVPPGVHKAWPSIDAADREAVMEVLDSGVLAGSNGPQAVALEREWAERLGVRRCLDELPGHAELARLFPMDFSLPHARERLKGTATDGPTQDHASAR